MCIIHPALVSQSTQYWHLAHHGFQRSSSSTTLNASPSAADSGSGSEGRRRYRSVVRLRRLRPRDLLGPDDAGGAGFLLGGLIATLRSNPTVGLFAAGTGLNCFALGSSYWGWVSFLKNCFDRATDHRTAIRATMMRVYQDPQQGVTEFTPEDMLRISGASGALTGFTLGLALSG